MAGRNLDLALDASKRERERERERERRKKTLTINITSTWLTAIQANCRKTVLPGPALVLLYYACAERKSTSLCTRSSPSRVGRTSGVHINRHSIAQNQAQNLARRTVKPRPSMWNTPSLFVSNHDSQKLYLPLCR